MSIELTPDETCYKCGAVVPQQVLPEYDDVPGQINCRPGRYQSGMFEHIQHCPGEPLNEEGRMRVEEAKKLMSNWMFPGDTKLSRRCDRMVMILVRVPRSVHAVLLEKAKGLGVPLEQYCVDVLSTPLRSLGGLIPLDTPDP